MSFATMDRDKLREIASKGGKAAHQKGAARQWTPAEARIAGRKGAHGRAAKRAAAVNAVIDDERISFTPEKL